MAKVHGNHELNCKICKMSKEAQEDLEFLYVNWAPIDEIAAKFKITTALIRRHSAQMGWFDKRLLNTKAKYAAIADSVTQFRGSDAVKALENLDKQTGTVEDREGDLFKKLDALTSLELNKALKELSEEKAVDDQVKPESAS
jgi:predicted signal transduction protein with EAL and GGDEF domain